MSWLEKSKRALELGRLKFASHTCHLITVTLKNTHLYLRFLLRSIGKINSNFERLLELAWCEITSRGCSPVDRMIGPNSLPLCLQSEFAAALSSGWVSFPYLSLSFCPVLAEDRAQRMLKMCLQNSASPLVLLPSPSWGPLLSSWWLLRLRPRMEARVGNLSLTRSEVSNRPTAWRQRCSSRLNLNWPIHVYLWEKIAHWVLWAGC